MRTPVSLMRFLVLRRSLPLLISTVAILLVPQSARAWGNYGHQMVNHAAVEHLPAAMPAFLKGAEAQIVYLGPEPDRWRAKDDGFVKEAQEPDHFMDLELVEGMTLPPGRYAFNKMMYAKAAATGDARYLPDKVGLQPYITMEIFDRLKVAFREYRRLQAAGEPTAPAEFNAIFYAGWLGHYVADGANPMHTTVNYNGWVGPNPKGYSTDRRLHYKFETAFVEDNLAEGDFSPQVKGPEELANPFQDYMAYMRASNREVPELYELDKRQAFDGGGTADGKKFVAQRLAAGTQMLLNLWYTAWMESATPAKDVYKAPQLPRKEK